MLSSVIHWYVVSIVSWEKAWLFNISYDILLHTVAISGQECMNTVGSLSHYSNIVSHGQTFIHDGYAVPCNDTVVAWEFCYRISSKSVIFYPGIWRVIRTSDNSNNTNYELVQSNNITYNQSIQTSGIYSCQRVNLSVTDQFTAPAGSVVGLYSNVITQLLHTNTNSSITTYQFRGNYSSVTKAGNKDNVNYNIAIKVHLGKYTCSYSRSAVCNITI